MIADDEHDTARTGAFDPRYDPAFQRGYLPQPGERTRTRVRTVAPDATREQAPADGRSAAQAAADRGESAWETAAYPVPAPAAPAYTVVVPQPPAPVALPDAASAAGIEPFAAVPAPGLFAGAELSPRRNPLMLALWLVGGGLVVLGVVIYAVAVNASYTVSASGLGADVGMQVLTQIGWVLAGPMITIGIATLVALLFVTALARRNRAPLAGEGDGAGEDDADVDEGFGGLER